jgi:hypothetical protein
MSEEQMLARARANYLETRPPVEISKHGPLLVAQTRDSYDASLLLDDKWCEESAGNAAGELLACVPARNVVLLGGTQLKGAVAEMRRSAKRIEAGGDHLISDTILVRRGGKWQQYIPLGAPPILPRPQAKKVKPWWRFW